MTAISAISLSLFYRYIVVRVHRSDIFCAGADQSVVVELLDHVRGPAADSGDGEDRSKQVDVETQRGVGGSRIEIHVGVEMLFALDVLLDRFRHVIPLGV